MKLNNFSSGPYKEQCARTEVEEAEFPDHNPLSIAVNAMRAQGYKVSSIHIKF